jgi:erythromycin esterase
MLGITESGDRVTRRSFLAAAGGAALLGPRAALGRASDGLQNWLAANARPVRSIDPHDEDFSDLEPIGNAIGGARVVQLGEPSHGAGSAFAAKARLISYLHRRLGFDVLIWESGLYDVALAQAAMRGSEGALPAARRGVFALWTEAREASPLFEYVKASQATLRPIEMAGFDMQITADGSAQAYAAELHGFADALHDPALRAQMLALADQATRARTQLFATRFSDRGDLDALSAAAQGLRTAVATHRAEFDRAWGALHTDFIDHTIENMRVDAAQRFEAAHAPATTPERENRRDVRNAANLRWLIETRYPGRKAIVWAHNVHVMKAYYSPDFRDVHLEPGPHDMKPSGVFLTEWLGSNAYTIGITAFAGSEAMATGGAPAAIPPAPDDSLEARLHALGHDQLFVDLRTRSGRDDPMHLPQIARMPKFTSVRVADPSRVYDGLFFIDRMAPATHV